MSEHRKNYLMAHSDIREMVWNGFTDIEEWEAHKEKSRRIAMEEQRVKLEEQGIKYLSELVNLQKVSNKLTYLKLITDLKKDD